MSFLDVEASLTGRRWWGPDIEVARATEVLVQRSTLPKRSVRSLPGAGFLTPRPRAFLSPSLRDLLPDPRSLKDMQRAATRVIEALQKRQKIAVFADYDVDGGSSAALLLIWAARDGSWGHALCAGPD